MNCFKNVFVVLCIYGASLAEQAGADVITTSSGRTIQGTVVQTNTQEILILADYGTVSLPANVVQSITPEKDKRPVTLSTNTVSSPGRLPEWKSIVAQLATKAWAENLRQIPATVVTNGVLKNVPYISFRCGIDYEVNIYGDLDNPAGIEVGFYRSLLSRSYAKENALAFIAAMLQREADRSQVQRLNRDKDMSRTDGMTFEVTPATAEDAYGGWWVSVYDEKALDQPRATDKELEQISVLNSAIIKARPSPTSLSWTKDDLKYARPSGVTTPRFASASPVNSYQTASGLYPDVAPEHDHGSVYVHGYFRQNGTYVQSYTRRR